MKKTFPCFLCQTPLEIKTTKKGKPVLMCMTDGVQAFVRYPEGIRRLEELTANKAHLLAGFVVRRSCDVAVKRDLQNIEDPFFHRAGIYCLNAKNFCSKRLRLEEKDKGMKKAPPEEAAILLRRENGDV